MKNTYPSAKFHQFHCCEDFILYFTEVLTVWTDAHVLYQCIWSLGEPQQDVLFIRPHRVHCSTTDILCPLGYTLHKLREYNKLLQHRYQWPGCFPFHFPVTHLTFDKDSYIKCAIANHLSSEMWNAAVMHLCGIFCLLFFISLSTIWSLLALVSRPFFFAFLLHLLLTSVPGQKQLMFGVFVNTAVSGWLPAA